MMYLVSIHRPHGFDHKNTLNAEVHEAIDRVNEEMVAAGVRVFVGGLRSPEEASSIVLQPDGTLLVSDGFFLESTEYVDGFWVLECDSQESAIEWGRKAAMACRGSVEVRPFAGAAVG